MKRNVRSQQQVEVAVGESVDVGGMTYQITGDNPIEVNGPGVPHRELSTLIIECVIYGSPCSVEFRKMRKGFVGVVASKPIVPVRKIQSGRARQETVQPQPKPRSKKRPNRKREAVAIRR